MPPKAKKSERIAGLDQVPILFQGADGLDERVLQAINKASGQQQDVLLDMCSWLAHVQDNVSVWEALKREVPKRRLPSPEIAPTWLRGIKRKILGEIQQGNKKAKSDLKKIEKSIFESQYQDGKDHSDPDRKGLFCGWCELITDDLQLLSPKKMQMHVEVQNGIRISEKTDKELPDNTFLVPFYCVEQIFVRQNPTTSAPKKQGIQFIIVPKAMTGASSILRDLPLPVIFNVPDSKPTEKLLQYGTADFYFESIQSAFDTSLKRFEKKVQRLSPIHGSDESNQPLEASWKQTSGMGEDDKARKQHATGLMYLLETGILFTSQKDLKVIYLPFRSVKELVVLVIKDMASAEDKSAKNGKKSKGSQEAKAVEINLVIKATEPWYDENRKPNANDRKPKIITIDDEADKDDTLITFTHIALDKMAVLKEYLKGYGKNGWRHRFCEMNYLDYSAGSLLSGMERWREE